VETTMKSLVEIYTYQRRHMWIEASSVKGKIMKGRDLHKNTDKNLSDVSDAPDLPQAKCFPDVACLGHW